LELLVLLLPSSLVSHQEDFAEAFSDGYHFALENGATKVKRFQK
jgi:hypothetical protein